MEGIDLAARCSPDVVLLDIEMPGIDGWETAHRLRRAHGSALKIIMVSANVIDMDGRDPNGHSHDAFLAKPIAFDALSATLQRQLGLQWDHATQASSLPQESSAGPLPVEARPYMERLRHLAQIGHVLGFEKLLAEFEHVVPGTALLGAAMREHLRTFDFDSIIERIANADPR
jgi:CheY-like chemotaxis protein